MTKSELIELMKEYLSVELRKIVREELQIALGTKQPEVKTESRKVIPKKIEKPVIKKQTFSKDPILNQLLNETFAESKWKTYDNQLASQAEYETTENTLNFTSDMAPSGVSTFKNIINQQHDIATPRVEEMLPEDLKGRIDQLPDFLEKALTRNYSNLVKVMDQKKR